MRLRLHPPALVELEEQRQGYGALLFDEVARRIGHAARWLRSGAPVAGFAGLGP